MKSLVSEFFSNMLVAGATVGSSVVLSGLERVHPVTGDTTTIYELFEKSLDKIYIFFIILGFLVLCDSITKIMAKIYLHEEIYFGKFICGILIKYSAYFSGTIAAILFSITYHHGDYRERIEDTLVGGLVLIELISIGSNILITNGVIIKFSDIIKVVIKKIGFEIPVKEISRKKVVKPKEPQDESCGKKDT